MLQCANALCCLLISIYIYIIGLSVILYAQVCFTCVLIAYIRISILYRLVPQLKNKSQTIIEVSMKEFGVQICVIYTTLLVFIHHLVLFTIEAFRFDIGNILLRTMASALITTILLIIFQFQQWLQ